MGELLGRLVERGTALGESRFLMARAELAQDLEMQVRRLALFAGAMLLVIFGLQFLVVSGFLALLAVLFSAFQKLPGVLVRSAPAPAAPPARDDAEHTWLGSVQ